MRISLCTSFRIRSMYRMNTINNRKANLLNQILSFVSGNMPFMNIALFLQSALFLAKGKWKSFRCLTPIGYKGLITCTIACSSFLICQKWNINSLFLIHTSSVPNKHFILGRTATRIASVMSFSVCASAEWIQLSPLTNIQHRLQTVQMQSVALFRTFIKEPEEHHHYNKPRNHTEKQQIKAVRLFQCLITTFQFLILTGIFQNIQIYIPVIIRILFISNPA